MEKLKKYQIEEIKRELREKHSEKFAIIVPLEMKELSALGRELMGEFKQGVLIGEDGSFVVFGKGAREIAMDIAQITGGKGGGKENFAQGKGEKERIKEGLNRAKELLGIE